MMPSSFSTFARSVPFLLASLLAAACAGKPVAQQPSGIAATESPAAPRSPDDISLELFAALARNDLDKATRDFSPRMASALSSFDLRQVWQQVGGAFGAFQSSSIHSRERAGELEVREVALKFERGLAIGRVAVKPSSGKVEGLFVRPATEQDLARTSGAAAASSNAPGSAARNPPGKSVTITGGRAEEVAFGAEPWRLQGTLTVPAGKGPFPAVLLVHGSGPHDRDQTIGPNRPFRDIAETLVRRGIASLRYDKRTLVHRERLKGQDITVEEEVIHDAAAAVALLKSRRELRPDGIFIAGHSLGAQLAPFIAERAGKVTGLILLAAPARPMPRAIVEQARLIGGVPPDKLAELERQAEAIVSGKSPGSDRFLGVPVRYFQDLLARDSLQAARRLAVPVLLLRGERDYQVVAEEQAAWQKALAGPKLEAHTLPELNHLFMAGKGTPGPAEYNQPGRVHASAPALMSAFVKRVVATR